jgi:hypothetical protein
VLCGLQQERGPVEMSGWKSEAGDFACPPAAKL